MELNKTDVASNSSYDVSENYEEYLESFQTAKAHVLSKVFIGIIYGSMMGVCGLGNLLIISVALLRHRGTSKTKILLTNLAVGDFFVAVFSAPFFLDFYLNDQWRFGSVMCRLAGYTKNTSLCVSTNTLLAIAIDRLVAIRYPFYHRLRLSKKYLYVLIPSIWILSAVIASPTVIYSTVIEHYRISESEKIYTCIEHWPQSALLTMESYSLTLSVIEFFIPLFVMIACYILISINLRMNNVQLNGNISQTRKKTIMRLILLVALFAISWIPYHSYGFYRDYFPKVWEKDQQRLNWFYLVEAIAMSNGIWNTIMYVRINAAVSGFLKELVYRVRQCHRDNSNLRTVRESERLHLEEKGVEGTSL